MLDDAFVAIECRRGDHSVRTFGENALPPGGKLLFKWLNEITDPNEWPFGPEFFLEIDEGFDSLDELENLLR